MVGLRSAQPPPPPPPCLPDTPPPPASLAPIQGMLPCRPSPGDPDPEPPIAITYACRDFGKVLKGRLLVHTADMHYSFELRGKMPNYVPPTTQDFKKSIDNT